jgi:hypothetical protein
MFGALIRAAERWKSIKVTELAAVCTPHVVVIDLRNRPVGIVSSKPSDASHFLLRSLVLDRCSLSPFAGSR